MGEVMIYTGKRRLVNSLGLEPGHEYTVAPLERRFEPKGFWVEVTDGRDVCRCPYRTPEEFNSDWSVVR